MTVDEEPGGGAGRPGPGSAGDGKGDGRARDGAFTVPNALAAVRLAASPGLVLLAATGRSSFVAGLFLALTFTDWLDGKLAVVLRQRTAVGARLDTVADVVMYVSLLVATAWAAGPALVGEWPWILAACLSYVVSVAASLLAFGVFPSYHTRAAKTAWFLMLIAVVGFFWGGRLWPLRLTAAAVVLTNLEGVLITRLLDEPRSDVPSFLQVLRERRQREEQRRSSEDP